jgi:hypothetical protein
MKAEELKKILGENFGYVGFGSISYIEPHTQIDDIVTVINSALSAKIELIEKDLTDKKIRELNPIWVRDEIIKRLKNG